MMKDRVTRRMLLASLSAVSAALITTRSVAAQWLSRSAKAQVAQLTQTLSGKIFFKGDPGYDDLRLAAVWNARKPPRSPPAIVMAESEADVVAAVKLAKARGWKVGVRSTGHSWVAPHTRDNALLINLSRMQELKVDAATRSAIASPAIQGQVLGKALREQGLMFPSGHCYGVGLGGYIMAGGHGWNSREWGPACASLRALDVVTASGELIHADATQNQDYYWAARGAGPGFFGVVTRYYLNVHSLPASMKASRYVYPGDMLEELFTWVRANMNAFPKVLEVLITVIAPKGQPQIRVSAVAMGAEAEVDAALDLMEQAPFVGRALSKGLHNKVVLPGESEGPAPFEPHGARIVIDGMWTDAPAEQLVPAMRRMVSTLPTEESLVLWQCWGPVQKLEDMAYSIQGDVYLSNVAVYRESADDARCDAWATGNMRGLEHVSNGSMMNDEKMVDRPSRYLSAEASRRLEALRRRHDPQKLFVSFLQSKTSA